MPCVHSRVNALLKAIWDWSLITYGGHGRCMPWTGIVEPRNGAAAMSIVETPDDADVLFPQETGLLSFQPRWEASKGAFGYDRKLRHCYFNQGGYVGMAKRYREYAKQNVPFKTLRTKQQQNPNVDRLVGAANVWNGDLVMVNFSDKLFNRIPPISFRFFDIH